eukprot:Em0019g365a
MALMGCEDGYECSVPRLPHNEVRNDVQCASQLDAASVQRIENVFQRGIKAWARMLLPDLKLKCDSELKIAFNIQSVAAPMKELTVAEESNAEDPVLPIQSSSITSFTTPMLHTMPITIRDVLKYKKPYTSIDARTLLVTLTDVPQAYIASLLTISNNHAGRLHFQAKVDKLYLTEGVALQEYRHSRSRVSNATVNFAVDFVYGDDNISRLAWEAKKRSQLLMFLLPSLMWTPTLRNELRGMRSDACTFLSYGYAVHVKKGVKASEEAGVHNHQPQEHEAQQFSAYQELEELNSVPDLFDEPATQEAFINKVKHQLSFCAQMSGSVMDQSEINGTSTHSPVHALDLAPDRRPNKNPKLGGYLGCSACRGTFLFYDRLRQVALAKLDQDPTRLTEIADILLSIYQCERRTFRYMAHVMLAAQQSHKMKQAIAEMDSSTAYLVLDFKQKFLANGFREGGDSYYGEKGMLWWGAGVYIKPPDSEEARISENEHYVEIDFTTDIASFQARMAKDDNGVYASVVDDMQVDEDVPEGDQDELDVPEGEQDELDVPEGEQDEDVPEGEQDELDVPEGDQDEDVPEGEQDVLDVPEGEQDELDVPEGEQDEDMPEGDQDELHMPEGEEDELDVTEGDQDELDVPEGEQDELDVPEDEQDHENGKQIKLLLPHVCSAAGLKLVAYYHNEAQSGKDVCDTYFSHQQTHVDAYLVQGDGGRKVSTPKQLAVALMTNSVCNTTVLLEKPDFSAAYRTAVIPAVPGISEFYAAKYITNHGKQEVQFFSSLGQNVPSLSVPIPLCHACSLTTPMDTEGINFTGVTVLLNSDSEGTCVARKERRRYSRRKKIRSVYQSIGRKPEAPQAAGRKRGRMQGSDGPTSGQKAKITYEQQDLVKNVSQWKKHELEAYLCHHRIAKTGNIPELVMRVSEHMQIARIEQE